MISSLFCYHPAPTLPRSISEVKQSLHLAKAYQIMDRLIPAPAADRHNNRCAAENLRNGGNYGYSAWVSGGFTYPKSSSRLTGYTRQSWV